MIRCYFSMSLLVSTGLWAGQPQANETHIPLVFERNEGQAEPGVEFLARAGRYTLRLEPGQVEFRSASGAAPVKMRLEGGSEPSLLEGLDRLPGHSFYYVGNDPSGWHTAVPTYSRVQYHDVYPGIDVIFYGSARQLEYDVVVAPHANPNDVRLRFDGARKVSVDGAGDLRIATRTGALYQKKPRIYQTNGSGRVAIEGRYVIEGQQVGLAVDSYDRNLPLVIDPVLAYATYFGGDNEDAPQAIAVDPQGNVYVAGETKSSSLPPAPAGLQRTPGGGKDAFITKMRPDGTVLYTTYLGGSADDVAIGIAVDAKGEAYVTGFTKSPNFPTTAQAYQGSNAGKLDAFVTKIRADGSALIYSTYLGGAENDIAEAIGLDVSGNAYITGYTRSDNFPVRNAVQAVRRPGDCGQPGYPTVPCSDVFVTKLNASGTMIEYSTYLGSSHTDSAESFQGEDEGYAIAVDKDGNAYVTGACFGSDFPVTQAPITPPGGQSAFVAKLNSHGTALVFGNVVGGNGNSAGISIALDGSGNVYVRGVTDATDFPVSSGAVQRSYGGGPSDAFVLKLNPSGKSLLYSTYLGGSGDEGGGYGLAADAAGNAYVSGTTTSTDFATTSDALQFKNVGGPNGEDVFLVKLNPQGTKLVYSTYLGGTGDDEAMGVALGPGREVYLTGVTFSFDFPTTPSALQPFISSGPDVFIAEITGLPEESSEPPVGPLAINHGGVVNAASSVAGAAVAPGSLAAVYGSFPMSSPSGAAGVPWPTNLSGLSALLGDAAVPLNYGSKNQLIIQVPWELSGQTQAPLTASMQGHTSAPEIVRLAAFAPGIFAVNGQGTSQGAILDSHGRLVDRSNPAAAGTDIQIYCTGLGPVSHQPASGDAATSDPLSRTTSTPTVTVGGVRAAVTFSGLAPGSVGLYQVNAKVGAGTPAGNAVPLVISIGGTSSNEVTIAVSQVSNSNPAPVVKSLSPSSAPAGSGPLKLTINGSGFIGASVVTFDGRPHAASLIGSTQVSITLSTADLAVAGSFRVVVSNPAPGGGVSPAALFTVTAAGSSLTGFWQGGWVSNMFADTNGSISANLVQTGGTISGTAAYNGSPCFTGGAVSGGLTGSAFSATLDVGGGQTVSLSGTVNAEKTFISGSYTLRGGSCAPNGDTGSFSLSKTP